MMHGRPAPGIRVVFEHREIHHPQRVPSGGYEFQILSHLQAQCAERVAHNFARIGTEENQVAVARRCALEDSRDRRIAQRLRGNQLRSHFAHAAFLLGPLESAPRMSHV